MLAKNLKTAKYWLLLLSMFLFSALVPAANAETAADFYRGKTVRLVIGAGPGGGYDAYARLIAPELEKRLDATVVVLNKPGGGGNIALNNVAAADPDGLTLMLANGPATVLGQLFNAEGIRFDLTKLTWLASVSSEARVVMVSPKSPFRSLDDLRDAAEIKWAATGGTSYLSLSAAFVSEAMGFNSRIIVGYKSSKEAALAAMRGEVDGLVVSATSARRYAKGGRLRPLVVVGGERSLVLTDLPSITEVARLNDSEVWWINYTALIARVGRALVTAPDVAADRRDYLRQVLKDILTDPEFTASAKEKGRPITFRTGSDTANIIADALSSLDGDRLSAVKAVALTKYR